MRLAAFALALVLPVPAAAQIAPGAPGERARWTNGNKQGIGTSTTLSSNAWFTLGEGALTETYYPTLDKANTRLLELVVADGRGFFERETADTEHRIEAADPRALAFRQVNTSRAGRYRIVKTVFTDPDRPVVLVRVRFEPAAPGLRLFAFLDPSVANSGLHDTAYVARDGLVAEDGGVAVALGSSSGFSATHCGHLGTSDGLAELRAGRPLPSYRRAAAGNVTLLAEVPLARRGATELTLALAFGGEGEVALREARASLARPPGAVLADYLAGWKEYLSTLRTIEGPHADLFARSAMVLKALEDKTHRGAMIASLTKPWGDEADASEPGVGGYHLVWSRDLYHVATAFLALGDKGAADRALSYLFTVQQRPDGSFPQNSWLDGRPFWPSLQLDEVAYPLVLAWQLGRTDGETYRRHVRPSAEFLVKNGPATPQERWEEEAGYSPSTIAAEIAGLVAAGAIAEQNGDAEAAARYRATADAWASRVDEWTVTRTGPHARHPYFLRLSQDGRPDSGLPLEINNGGGTFDEREILDAGFLELVRLGIRPPSDPVVVASLEVVDRVLRVETPAGPAFYRYNHDGYGEKADGRGYDGTGIGRLWPLLTGERGEYELLAGRDARPYLDALAGFANEGGMLPEQVWDRSESPRPHLRLGRGSGSATPLAWTCAQLIRLALAVEDGRLPEMPEVVRRHFQRESPR
jgi:glucoamylase